MEAANAGSHEVLTFETMGELHMAIEGGTAVGLLNHYDIPERTIFVLVTLCHSW